MSLSAIAAAALGRGRRTGMGATGTVFAPATEGWLAFWGLATAPARGGEAVAPGETAVAGEGAIGEAAAGGLIAVCDCAVTEAPFFR